MISKIINKILFLIANLYISYEFVIKQNCTGVVFYLAQITEERTSIIKEGNKYERLYSVFIQVITYQSLNKKKLLKKTGFQCKKYIKKYVKTDYFYFGNEY